MQIVIDISDKVYGLLKYFEKALGLVDKKEEDDVKTALMRAVVNGTPLPKGHGDLIDVCEFNKYLIGRDRSFQDLLKLIPVVIQSEIIEADKGE